MYPDVEPPHPAEVITMEQRNGHATTHEQPPSSPRANGVHGVDFDARGKFAAGNKVGQATRFRAGNQAARGPGCPFLRHMARVRTALFKALTDERVEEMVVALVAMVVKDHNLAAAEFLVRHCVGPELRFNVDPDMVDVLELERLRGQGQGDGLGNSRLSPQAALALERAYQDAATVGTLAEELLDPGSDVARHLLAALKDAGLHELLRAVKAYSDSQLAEGDRHAER
jgi:hypothetical protein